MKKQLILGALLALVCGCQNNAQEPAHKKDCHKGCTEKKCNATTEVSKPAASVAAPAQEQAASREVKVVEVKAEATAAVEAKKSE